MRYKEIACTRRVSRRRDRRWIVLLGVFVMVFIYSFMAQSYKDNIEVGAASLDGFDPGFIISDYTMSNYNSMSEAEIQAFLTKKNPCSNTSYDDYVYLSAKYSNLAWHFENGHFVCLSEELFGDGEMIGSGETAAHIIWQAAQDYKINPQVLIVLLQKEQSLITDSYPNSVQYRSATGYGCPDTAACSSKYYGFKNQVRNAAAMFRTVLDGGWTNYPLGNNYIQYNPNASCGGSVVNIRSLATSALYRYTPYQPNAGAIAAGYGTAYCGAYGNRNFYLYFEDWFGGITKEVDEEKEINSYVRGNTATLGAPLAKVICGLHNDGCYQAFGAGYVYWSPSSGAHLISGAIFDRWFKLGTEWSLLGYPTGEQETTKDGGLKQKFEKGEIYYTKETGAYDVSGGIYQEYLKNGTEWGVLGYPTSSELRTEKGVVYQTFENGAIYWDVKTGAWVVMNFAREKWESLGGFNSKLGSVVNKGVCGLVKQGCYQAFKSGNIYYTKETGAYDVSGGIYQEYLKNGTEWGVLGYPTSSELRTEKGVVYQTFENGAIYWDVKTGATTRLSE